MTTIVCETAIVNVSDSRHNHCGLCGILGHNRRTCPQAPSTEKGAVKKEQVAKEEITYWTPNLFSGGGVRALPSAVAWAPGTDSIAFFNQMKNLPYYRYDDAAKLWRRI